MGGEPQTEQVKRCQMSDDELRNLKRGDLVRSLPTGVVYVVTGNYGDHVTAAATADITNPPEWELLKGEKTNG